MKQVASVLSNAGNEVLDLAERSWVLSDSSIASVLIKLGTAKINSSTVVIIDPLSNSAARFRQADDSLSLAIKMEGGWHLPGEIVWIGEEQIRDSLNKLKPALEKIDQCKKVFIPPVPRYFFAGCCGRDSHCTNVKDPDHSIQMLQEHTRIRTAMKNHIINNTQTTLRKNIRILDLIGTLNTDGTHSQITQLNSLKHFTARDNVHLTSDGYIKLAAGAAREAAMMIKADDMKARIPGNGRPIPYWRGFVIHQGIGQVGGHLGLGGSFGGGAIGGNMRGRGASRGGRGRGASRHHPYKMNVNQNQTNNL
jgi:hypothetical protein